MKNQIFNSIVFGLITLVSFASCTLDNDETQITFLSSEDYELVSNSLSIENDLPNFSSTNEELRDKSFDAKALVGRVLFYDKHLSGDNSVSCASCHDQKLGFADDKAFSEGIDGQLTERNSIAFSAVGADNSADNPYFGDSQASSARMFWDHRAGSVTEQLKETIENEVEMAMPLVELPGKLNNVDYLRVLFRRAYAESDPYYTIQEEDILDALLKFMQSMNPSNSKFDQFHKRNFTFNNDEPPVELTNLESTGMNLYNNKCATCHGFGLGQPTSITKNNGLDYIYEDTGDGDSKFKVPGLRNVALSAPYMHDGRFETLEEVIEHYSSGIRNHNNLSIEIRSLINPQASLSGFNFTDTEKEALLQFLNILTDDSFVNDERFSSPF